jgi:protease II
VKSEKYYIYILNTICGLLIPVELNAASANITWEHDGDTVAYVSELFGVLRYGSIMKPSVRYNE